MAKRQFYVEGNIGCGKSTLLGMLSGEKDVETFQEPLNVWQSIEDGEGRTLLDVYYKDPKRYGYLFQSTVFKTRLKSLDVPQQKQVRVVERSILTDYHVFMKTMIDLEMVSSIEHECYLQWYNWLKDAFFVVPTAIIYIRSDPGTCYERIKGRGRGAETGIGMDYLQKLHDKHNEWLCMWKDCPVYTIDNPLDKDIHTLYKEVMNVIST